MNSNGSKEKFIAFLDIVGFKSAVEKSEAGVGLPFSEITAAVTALGTAADQAHFDKYGPIVCPEAERIERDLDFRVTPASDSAIISAEISPAGVINLLSHCATACFALLTKGLMIRGYVTKGRILHTTDHQIGSE